MPKSNYEYVKIAKVSYSPKEYWDKWYEQELTTHIYGINQKHEFVNLQVSGCKPRIWVKQNPDDVEIEPEMRKHITQVVHNECVTYSNHPEPLYTVYMDYPFMTAHSAYRDKGLRGYFEWTGQADIPFRDAVRWFYGWKDIIKIPKGKRILSIDDICTIECENPHHPIASIRTNDAMLDIEAFNDDGSFADGKHPTGTIYCWSVKDLRTGITYHGTILSIDKKHILSCLRDGKFLYENCTINKKKYKKDFIEPMKNEIKLYQFDSEAKLIGALKTVLEELGINIIEGFNVEDFDVSYIRNRIRNMNKNVAKKGHSRYNDDNSQYKEYFPKIDFDKMMTFDLMEGYRKYRHKTTLQVEDKRVGLDWLGQNEIGFGKLKRPSMTEMRDNDHDLMSIYNIWDVELPSRIEEKLGVLEYYKDCCADAGCSIDHYGSMIFLAESAVIHKVGCKEIFPSRRFVPRIFMEKRGANVQDASTGVYKNMIELDLSGQYPGAIMTGNLDLKTIIDSTPCEICENKCKFITCIDCGYKPFTTKVIENEIKVIEESNSNLLCGKCGNNNWELTIGKYFTGCGFKSKENFVVFPSGRMYDLDKEGTIPGMMHELRRKRNVIRSKMKELSHDKDDYLYKKCKKDQEIAKHSMASWSGGFGTVGGKTDFVSRFADNGIYNDITEISRLLRDWNREHIEDYSCIYNYDRKSIISVYSIDYDPRNKPLLDIKLTVRYGDTDSTKCTINNMEELEKNMGREFTKGDLQVIGEHYAEMLNKSYGEFSKKYLGIEKHYFSVKMEDPIKAYFQWGKKKLYVELDFNNVRHDKGAATVRSDKGVLMKECMDYILDKIIFDEKGKLSDYLSQIESDILSGKYNVELGTPQRIKVVTNMWYGNMMYSNKLFDGYDFKIGDKPTFFYLKKLHEKQLPKNCVVAFKYGENPKDYGGVIDYDKHLQIIKTGLVNIFGGLDTTWNDLRDGMKKRSIEELF